MSIFDRLFSIFRKKPQTDETSYEPGPEDEIPEVESVDRAGIDMTNRKLRERYVRNLCDQMMECTEQIEAASREYRYVTDYLKDCELIEKIPEEAGNCLISAAENVVNLLKENEDHSGKLGRISEAKFEEMDNIAADMPAAYEEMKKNEEYKEVVKDDLKRLEGEKFSRRFLMQDARMRQQSCRNVSMIVIFAMSFVILILLLLRFMFDMNVIPGFIMAAALGSISLTVAFSISINCRSVERKNRNEINQIIAKQNTVKIRYVNVQNLILYEHEKYHVNSSKELKRDWDLYLEEKHEREVLRRMSTDLELAEERYRQELVNANVSYPTLWVHQVDAVLDRREMVELRHELVSRRQGLRKRIEYNTQNRDTAKKEVEDLVAKYPHYAREILEIVDTYE